MLEEDEKSYRRFMILQFLKNWNVMWSRFTGTYEGKKEQKLENEVRKN